MNDKKGNSLKIGRLFLKKIFLLINYSFVALILLSYLASYVNPEFFSGFAFLGLAYPILLLINIVFVLFWVIKRQLYFLISFIAILIGGANIGNLIQYNSNEPSEENIKVLSYNVKFQGRFLEGAEKIKARQEILNTLDSVKANIICLQEFHTNPYSKKSKNLRSILNRLGKMNYYNTSLRVNENNENEFGLAFFTKYKIINKETITFDNTINMAAFIDIKYKSDTIRVYNIHLASIRFGKEDYSFFKAVDYKTPEEELKKGSRNIYKRLKLAFEKRSIQANIISNHIKKSPYRVIVCGDFNDTSISYAYNIIKGDKLQDSFTQSGLGVGTTYNGIMPSFRIDHILLDKSFRVHTHNVIKNKDASDHLPIVAEFSIPEKL